MNENRITALREIWVAKLLMLNGDYLDSMLSVCDILLLAAGIKLSDSEINKSWIFELLKPSQKLLTSLQPIRDDFPGTDLALQFLRDAFSSLSDQEKHSDYDLLGGCMYMCDRTLGRVMERSNLTEVNSKNSKSFELFPLRDCDKDEQVDLITYQASHSENNSISNPMIRGLRKSNQEFYNFEKNRKLEDIHAGQIRAAHLQKNVKRSYRYALINYNGIYELYVTWLKPIPISPSQTRWYFSGVPVGCGSFDLNPLIHDLVSPMIFSYKCSPVHTGTEAQFEIYPKIGEIWAPYKNWNCNEWANNPQKLRRCKFDLVEMLSDFSKASGAGVCLQKFEAFRSVFQRQTIGQYPVIYQIPSDHLFIFSHSIPDYRLLGGDNGKVGTAMFELDQSALPDDMVHGASTEIILVEEKLDYSPGFTPTKYLPSLESSADSQLLKHTWSPDDFGIDQVWAVYCGKENMPRPYVQIVKVIPVTQVYVTLLEPLPVFHLDTEWKKKNLPMACGLFELRKTSVILKMSHFSDSMQYERSVTETEPHFIIYPKKGEVWAVYEDWNEEWQQNDYKNCHYYIVEILSDLLDENGMTVARLVEVENNLTFFRRQQNDSLDITCTVSQAEMFSFSHKIPAFKVQGTAMYGVRRAKSTEMLSPLPVKTETSVAFFNSPRNHVGKSFTIILVFAVSSEC